MGIVRGIPRSVRPSLIAAVVLGLVFLALSVRGTNWNDLLATARNGRPDYLVIAFVILSGSYYVRGYRWGIILSAEKRIDSPTLFWATMVGYLGNNFLPARAGEIIRSVMLGRRTGLSKTFVLATALVERILDAGALVLISMVAVLWIGDVPEWLHQGARLMALVSAGGVVGLLVAPRLAGFLTSCLKRLPLPTAFHDRLVNLLDRFLVGLASFQHPGRAATFAVLTLFIWLVDALVGILTARAFDISISLPLTLTLLGALGLASAVPSTPGYVGVYQFVAVTVLVPFGLTSAQALVFIIALQGVTYASVVVWGAIGFWQLNRAGAGVKAMASPTVGEFIKSALVESDPMP